MILVIHVAVAVSASARRAAWRMGRSVMVMSEAVAVSLTEDGTEDEPDTHCYKSISGPGEVTNRDGDDGVPNDDGQ